MLTDNFHQLINGLGSLIMFLKRRNTQMTLGKNIDPKLRKCAQHRNIGIMLNRLPDNLLMALSGQAIEDHSGNLDPAVKLLATKHLCRNGSSCLGAVNHQKHRQTQLNGKLCTAEGPADINPTKLAIPGAKISVLLRKP